MARKIDYQVNLTVNKAGLNDIYSTLKNIQTQADKASSLGTLTNELSQASIEAKKLESILNSAWNSKLNQWDLSKVNQSIIKTYGSIDQMKTKLESLGQGNIFNKLQSDLLSTNLQLKQSNKLLDDMATTFANTIRFGISSSIFNRITNEIQRAYEYSVKLDTSLNDIRIVSNKSADDMERFAVQANKAAKALGSSTLDYTQASTIYYQQGLGDAETAARTEVTLKAANVTAQTGKDVSEQLTAIWNGYKVSAEETELYIDKVAKVAASTAADLEEMATGMSKVASAANSAGVDIDQLNATLATVISVTREAPETIGSAFKTIYARMGDLALDGKDEYGVTLGNVSSKLHELGIEILDEQGNMRDMGDVIEDTAEKWQTWTQAQKQAAAVAMAGKMQYSRLIALFDNWDMYTQALKDSQNAVGTLQEQQDIYMESTEAHLQQLKTEAERTYGILFDMDTVNDFSDALTGALSIFNNFLDTTGGGLSSLLNLATMLGNAFSKQIGAGINQMVSNYQMGQLNERNAQAAIDMANQEVSSQGATENEVAVYEREVAYSQELLGLAKNLSTERYNELNTLKHNLAQDELRVAAAYDYLEALEQDADYEINLTKELKKQTEEVNNLKKIQKDLSSTYKEINELYTDGIIYKEEEQELLDNQWSVMNQLDILATKGLMTDQQSAQYESMLNDLAEDRALDETQIQQAQQIVLDILNQQISRQEQLQRLKEAQKILDSGELNNLEQKVTIQERLLKAQLEGEARKQAIQGTVQGLTTIVSLSQQFVGIISTLNDESLTGWEKFGRTSSTLLFTLPMLITNFSSLTKLLPNLAVALGATGKAADYTAVSALKAQISIWGLKLSLIEFIAIAAAVVAVIGLMVTAGVALYNEYTKDARAAEEAAKQAKVLEDNYNSLSEAAKELKENISGYENAKKDLADLKIGTEEYAEALENANTKAKELIETYGLYDKVHMENGVLTFDKGVLEDVQKQQNIAVSQAESMKYNARITANEANITSQTTDLRRDVGQTLDPKQAVKDLNPLTITKHIIAPLTLIGDTLDNYAGMTNEQVSHIVKSLNELNEKDFLDVTKTDEAFSKWVQSISNGDYNIQLLSEQIGENRKGFIELANQTEELTKANKYYLEQINLNAVKNKYSEDINRMAINPNTGKIDQTRANQLANIINESNPQKTAQEFKENRRDILNETGLNRGSEWSHEFSAFMNGRIGTNETDLNKYLDETLRNFGVTEEAVGKIKDNESLAREYAKTVLKMTDEQVSALQFADNKLKDAEGNLKVDVTSAEERGNKRAAILDTAVTEQGDKDVDNAIENIQKEYNIALENMLNTADEMGNKYGVRFSDAILNGLSSKDGKIDLASALPMLGPDDVEQLKQMNDDQLKEILGITDETAAQLGEEKANQLLNGFKEGIQNWDWNAEDAIAAALGEKESELETIGDDLSKKKFEELKEEAAEYSKTLMDVATSSEELADSVSNDAEEATNLALQIMKMNKAIDTLADNWKNWSDILKNSSKTSQEYSKALNSTKDAVGDLLDIDSDAFSQGFVTSAKNMELIGKAAKGDEKAIDELRKAALDDIILNMVLDDSQLTNLELLDKVHYIQSLLDANGPIVMGTEIDLSGIETDSSNLLDYFNAMILEAGMTKEQVNNMLSGMGFTANFASQPQKIQVKEPDKTITHHEITDRKKEEINGGEVESFTETTWSETIPGEKHEGDVDAYSLETAKPGTTVIPKINSIKKSASGASNNYSSKNKGGKSPGKSSGGGGGSKKEPNKEKKVENKKDPYHDIDIQLKDISTKLDKVQSQQSKFFGQKLINNLNQQYELLGQQIDKTREKIIIARQEQAKLQQELSKKGVLFNADGTIANYAAAYNAQLNYVNSLIDKYNSMSAEEQEKYKETLDNAKEDFNKFTESISEYDKTVTDTIPQLEKDIQDAIDEQIEIQITKFNMEIEIRLDLAEAERDWNEFKRKVIDQIKDEDILGNARAKLQDFYSYYKDDETGIIQRNTVHVENILSQLKQIDETGWSDVYGDNRAQALEDLQTYYQQLMSDLEDIEDLQEEIHDAYIDMIDEAQEKFNEQLDTYEQISSLIEHDIKLIQLLNGEDNSYKELVQYYEKQEENYNKQLDFQRQQVDFWRQQMELAEEGSEEWQAAKENWMDAVGDWRSSVEDAVDNITNKYINAINLIFEKLNDKVTNGAGLDYISEEWDLINQNAEQYLDTINSMYGIQSLQNKYLDAIDQTDNIAAQRKLNALMQEELAALEQKDKLTQYDIDRANMKYEIALKQIALEEAQQNKSTMRLRRDSQGNYSYQFVTDEDEIGTLKDELADLYNQLYNFDLDRYKDNLDQIYSAWEEYQEKMAEAAQINDPEKRAERELLLNEQYGELINGLVEQNETIRLNLHESAFTELADLYNTDLANFQQLTQDEQDILLNDMIPQWSSGVQQMADVFAGEDGFANVCKEAMEELKQATEDYEDSLNDTLDIAGIVFDDIANGTDNTIIQTEDLLWKNDELIESYGDQLQAIRDIIAELGNLITKYNTARDAALAASEAAFKYWQEQEREAAAAAAKENAQSSSSNTNSTNNTNTSSSGSSTSGYGNGDGVLRVGDVCTYTGGTYYYDSYGTSPSGNRGPGKQVTVTQVKEDGRPYPIHVQSKDSAYGWLKKSQLSGYDTGGYTGNWGDNSGKLALLHKKELVLNSNDTPNMLNAVYALRGIIDTVGSSMLSRLAQLGSGINAPTGTIAASTDTIEQNVHIDATFPGVQNAKEIEDALNNLVNRASQRTYRKKN